MKKKFIFFTLLLLTLIGGAKFNVLNAQETITIGGNATGTSQNYPMGLYYPYTLTQQIYTSSDINYGAGVISEIAFKINISNATRNVTIYMKNTDKSVLSGLEPYSPSDKVFHSDNLVIAATENDGWMTIDLDTDFLYEGQNIVVSVLDNTGSYTEWNKNLLYKEDGFSYGITYYGYNSSSPITEGNQPTNWYQSSSRGSVRFTISPAPASVEVTPEFIDFGKVRIGDYWTEKPVASANVEIKAIATTIKSISCDNNFFILNYDLNQKPVALNVSYNKEANVSGAQSGNITITSADCEPVVIPVTATAYTPANGDVYENPITVNFDANNSFTAQATGMYDDYILPDEAEDGNLNDAVYKFTLANDGVVTANVNGTNAIAAIYKAEDLQGNGPSSDNNYNGIVSGPSAPTTFFYDFEDGSLEDFNLVEYDGNNDHWVISDEYQVNNKNLVSFSYIYGKVNKADNYIFTKSLYEINANSKLTFDAKCGGAYNYAWDKVMVKVSTDGEVFTLIETVNPASTSWVRDITIDLGAKFAEKGLAYGDYYIALHHQQNSDIYNIAVDNLALTDVSAKSRAGEAQIDGVQYPAGIYYLVAAAEGDFTLNLSTSSLPAPAEFAYTAPENNTIVEETNPELTWESAQYATSYDVYLGTTADALSIKAENITATSYQTTDLSNNTKYYWQVVAKNSVGNTEGAEGDVWSFVTPLDVPQNVTASSNNIYPDNTVTISWTKIAAAKGYNVYIKVNGGGEGIAHNHDILIEGTSYQIENMDYSKNGHEVYVTAVYEIDGEEYESKMSDAQTIKVTDYVALSGTITDGTNPIAGAKISLAGTDEFGTTQTYTFTSGKNGVYGGNVLVGSYTITVSRFDYKTFETTIEFDEPVDYALPISMESNPVVEFEVNAEENGDNVNVSWTADYTSYNVYRRDSEGVTKLTQETIAVKQYSDNWSSLPNGEYEYGVSAMVMENAKDILNENLNVSMPANWTYDEGWKVDYYQSYYYNNSWYNYVYPNGTQNYSAYHKAAYFHIGGEDDYYNNYSLSTPVIDLTNYDSPSLSFYYNNYSTSNYAATISVKVRVYENDSYGAWTSIFSTTAKTNGWINKLLQEELKKYSGKKIQIAFTTNKYGSQLVGIDDIVISAKPISESKVNWSAPVEKGGIAFTGNGNWNNEENWNRVPSTTDKVTIKGNATITENVTVGSIRIASGATLTVKSGVVLNVTNGISNTNAAALVMEDGAQIIQTNSNVAATFNMIIVNPTQGWGKNKDGWQFIASPLLNAKTSAFETSGENNDFDLYKYDGTEKGAEWVNYKNHKRVGDTFEHNFNDGTLCGWTNLDATNKWTNSTGGIDGTYCLTSSNSGTSYVMSPKVLVEKGSKFYFTAKVAGYSDQNISVAVSETGNIDDMVTKLNVTANTWKWQDQAERYITLDEYAGKEIYIIIKTTSVYNGYNAMSIDNLRLENAGGASDGTFETEFVNGRAYLASYQAATTATFTGVLNYATSFSEEFSYNDANNGDNLANFHLLGNPFTFDMDMTKATYKNLVAGVAIVDGTGGYTYVGTGKEQTTIPVGDGFFVKVKATDEDASFEYNADSKRSRSTDVNSINIIASGKAGKDNVIVNFAGKSEGFDKLQNFNDEIATVYVAEGNKHYGIYNCDEDVQEIELAFEAKEMGSYTMAIEADGKFQSVTLVDRFTGIETNMLMEDYHFTATSGNNTKRFVVRLDNGQESTDNSQFVYQNGEELILTVEGAVQIVDVMGRVVYNNEVVSDNNRIDVSSFINGAYIVRVINEEGVKAQKVVIY